MGQSLETQSSLASHRQLIRDHYCADEFVAVRALIDMAALTEDDRKSISARAATLVQQVRDESSPTMMEKFLAEYGLSTKEGVALMCLAEALLRVPDDSTIDALIHDKVASGKWGPHIGQSESSLINSATWALMITGKVIVTEDVKGVTKALRHMVKRMGEPVVRAAVAQAMKELGRQFVLGRTIEEAIRKAKKLESKGYTHSYDMLGEGARTDADALRYLGNYAAAITQLAAIATDSNIRKNPGISLKLSALYPRYEFAKYGKVMDVLVARTTSLALQAKAGNMGFNIDAEEADRLDLSLEIIEAVLSHPSLHGWDGFGVVVQAFCPRASFVIDWLYALAEKLDRKIMVRLVKGAYWDAEIKHAQVLGLQGYPVFTRKMNSDVSYIACARKLMGMRDRIYPQFATHNAHSVAAVLHLADDRDSFEFQRLHGMGESLYESVLSQDDVQCRIYAPVGAHKDLLAYLVRRLLENGANSSFVNQIVDPRIKPETIAMDPIAKVLALGHEVSSQNIPLPKNLYGGDRVNSVGWDITRPDIVASLHADMEPFKTKSWHASPIVAGNSVQLSKNPADIFNPCDPTDCVGTVTDASVDTVQNALTLAHVAVAQWSATPVEVRAACLNKVGALYETHAPEIMALLAREAGKTLTDAIGEIREAVDFAHYYAAELLRHGSQSEGVGVVACISPWNFPLAIFSGQILAALAAGNAVVAKPADQTPLIAHLAILLMHEAGIPVDVLHLLPGSGKEVGEAITGNPLVSGVCFTGSTLTAQRINKVIAQSLSPSAPFIAETGGLNAMIVDSTALPEQVVRDVIASSFQSAGQRCSALRMLYLQEDIADNILHMLFGAMDELTLGDPWDLSTDVGPVIDIAAQTNIQQYCDAFQQAGKVLKSVAVPSVGKFVGPTVIRLTGIGDLDREIFGPVLHVATFKASELDAVVDAINVKGYGLTFGLHTRVDTRVDRVINRIHAGNIYVNRNQIGAVVGTQPFGGEGMSGTGPKAGGPHYLTRFMRHDGHAILAQESPTTVQTSESEALGGSVGVDALQTAIDGIKSGTWSTDTDRAATLKKHFGAHYQPTSPVDLVTQDMPGPTGELNQLTLRPRGVVVCLGLSDQDAMEQAYMALSLGNAVVMVSPQAPQLLASSMDSGLPVAAISGQLDPSVFATATGFHAVACKGSNEYLSAVRFQLSLRDGPLLPLIMNPKAWERFVIERHLCIDTTAAGGNASLIASVE